MELSIIVWVYNMSEDIRLEYCLDSLLNQTMMNYEIIAVDDASTDNTSQVLLEYSALYPDVFKVMLLKEHRGRGGAYNAGLKHARGRWIGFIDSYDRVMPWLYESLWSKASETGADMVSCQYQLQQDSIESIEQVLCPHYEAQTGLLDTEKRKLLMLDFGKIQTKIFKRKVILDCGMKFPEKILFEEEAIANAIVLRAKHFEFVDEPLYTFCEPNMLTTDFVDVHNMEEDDVWKYCEHSMEAAHILLKYAKDYGYLDAYYDVIVFQFINLFYIKPLVWYLDGIRKKDSAFPIDLLNEARSVFRYFEENPHYKERIGSEYRKLIRIQKISTTLMIWWYKIKEKIQALYQESWTGLVFKLIGGFVGVMLSIWIVILASYNYKTLEYPIVLFGDSIIANDYFGDEIDVMLSKALGEDVFNAGFGGSCLSNQNLEYFTSYSDETLSMEELTNSIITGDFLVQKSAIKRASRLDYYESRLDTLSKIDFEKTHTVVIEHGVNDYGLQIPPEKMGENLRNIIVKLQEKYPDLQIWICSPTYSYIMRGEEKIYCDTTGIGSYVLEEYVLMEQKICEEMGVGFIDNYHQDIITKETLEQYSLDGLHLNEAGRQVIADNILKHMKNQS